MKTNFYFKFFLALAFICFLSLDSEGQWANDGVSNIFITPAAPTSVRVGVGTVTPASKFDAVANFSTQLSAVRGVGINGPTNGYLGATGSADYDGTGLNITGFEVGVLGISIGVSDLDNYGVYAFANGTPGFFLNSGSMNNYVALANQVYDLEVYSEQELNVRFNRFTSSYANVMDFATNGSRDWALLVPSGDDYLTIKDKSGDNTMTFDQNGYVGVNMVPFSMPQTIFHVRQIEPNRAYRTEHQENGNFWTTGIGTSTQNYRWEYNGTGKGQISSVDGAYSTISDRRLKANIETLDNVLEGVMQLKPSRYNFKDGLDAPKSIGFIAQEVEEIFPYIVRETDDNLKMLAYHEFSVLAIAAIQELNMVNEEKDERINVLEDRLDYLESMFNELETSMKSCCVNFEGLGNDIEVDKASLGQNVPNPFRNTTTISYYLPTNTINAFLRVFDMQGRLVKEISLSGEGHGQVNFDYNGLSSGNYMYSLFINEARIDTRQMILER